MKITNETPFAVGPTIGWQRDGRELVVIAIKASYVLCFEEKRSEKIAPLELVETQKMAPLIEADEFSGEPATTSPVLENDFAHFKPECDILFRGSAHAAERQPSIALNVLLKVGNVSKDFIVVGERVWQKGWTGTIAPGKPKPFASQPITYDFAFGGTDPHPKDPKKVETFLENPVGRGFRKYNLELDGTTMPLTEEREVRITDPKARYRPLSLGPLGRNWLPRMKFAGTYDQTWMENRAPLWPDDFDLRYFQAAPADQRMPHPRGGEQVELRNLVPAKYSRTASIRTHLPTEQVGAYFLLRGGAGQLVHAAMDTVLFEPDENRFSCTWRAVFPTHRDAFDVREVVVGVLDVSFSARMRARMVNKPYYPSLDAAIRAGRTIQRARE